MSDQRSEALSSRAAVKAAEWQTREERRRALNEAIRALPRVQHRMNCRCVRCWAERQARLAKLTQETAP